MLTQNDITEIEAVVDKKLDEKLRFVPTKDLFLEKMDELMSEVKGMREEFTTHTMLHQDINDNLDDNNNQIKQINQKLNLSY